MYHRSRMPFPSFSNDTTAVCHALHIGVNANSAKKLIFLFLLLIFSLRYFWSILFAAEALENANLAMNGTAALLTVRPIHISLYSLTWNHLD